MAQLDGRQLGFRKVHSEYRSRAHRDKLEWTLTTEQFFLLLTQPCYYCGTGPGRVVQLTGRRYGMTRTVWDEDELFICGGIDRLDSTRGYDPANTVSCCTMCNLMKRQQMPEDFLAHVERIYRHQQSKTCNASVDH